MRIITMAKFDKFINEICYTLHNNSGFLRKNASLKQE